MLGLIIITSLLYFPCVYSNGRIVNGKDADEGEFTFMILGVDRVTRASQDTEIEKSEPPLKKLMNINFYFYTVSLRDNRNNHFCGGTILNENHVLTAAHCFCDSIKPDPPYTIQYGSTHISKDDARSVKVSNFTCHSDFNLNDMIFDVAVLKLETSIPEGTWTTAELSNDFSPSLFSKGVIVGWGSLWDGGTASLVLQKLDVDVVLDAICGVKFNTMHDICLNALFSGACYGDSGSALLVNGVQVGIASFITSDCGSSSLFSPNVYARVSTYLTWISDVAKL